MREVWGQGQIERSQRRREEGMERDRGQKGARERGSTGRGLEAGSREGEGFMGRYTSNERMRGREE